MRIFIFTGHLEPKRFDDHKFPDEGAKSNVLDHKLTILNGGTYYHFTCPSLNTLLHGLGEFHNEHNEKMKAVRNSQTREAHELLSQYEADIEANLHRLLAPFDNILQDPAADWSSDKVNFAFPKQVTITHSRKSMLKDRRQALLIAEWNNDPEPQGGAEEGGKGPVGTKDGRSLAKAARGKGRARKAPGNKRGTARRNKLNAIPEEDDRSHTTRSSGSRGRNT